MTKLLEHYSEGVKKSNNIGAISAPPPPSDLKGDKKEEKSTFFSFLINIFLIMLNIVKIFSEKKIEREDDR